MNRIEVPKQQISRMINQFQAASIQIAEDMERARLVQDLREREDPPLLVLDTCQRLEVYGWKSDGFPDAPVTETWDARDALRHLARIAAGLESRIVGELEILGQVREAYKRFATAHGPKDRKLDRLFQDAIALARKARKQSGIDQNLTGLGALAARIIIDKLPDDAPVAVIGSGSLSRSVARYLHKRSALPVRVASRCPQNAMRLALEVNGFSTGLNDVSHLLDGVSAIVTATAAPHPILYPDHIAFGADPTLVLDLGEPADCHEDLRNHRLIDYVGLLDVEARAKTNTEERLKRAAQAEKIIEAHAAEYNLR